MGSLPSSNLSCCCAQSCLTVYDRMDYSLPGSCVYGIFQEEHGSGLLFLLVVDLPNPGIQPAVPVSPALAGRFFTS